MSVAKVSVVMAAYNASPYIENSIQSFLDQTWPNKELIIIDDGSTDNTLEVASHYMQDTVRVFTIPNCGQCGATNEGIRHATGSYIQFLDADDYMHPEKLSYQMQTQLECGPSYVTFSQWASVYGNARVVPEFPNPAYISLPPVPWLTNFFRSGAMLANSCYLMHRSLLEKAGGYNEALSLNNDIEFFTRIALQSRGMYFCENALTYYRRSSDTLSQRFKPIDLYSELEAKRLACTALFKQQDDAQVRNAVSCLLSAFIYRVYPISPELAHEALTWLTQQGCVPVKQVGSSRFRFLSSVVGFRSALRLMRLFRALRS